MARTVWLDPRSDNPDQDGCVVVNDAVTMVQNALGTEPLHVRGATICAWAEVFGEGRNWSCRWLSSPAEELIRLCPSLSPVEADWLVAALASRLRHLARPLELAPVLASLWPDAGVWASQPTTRHAAAWLGWLAQPGLPKSALKLAQVQAGVWASQADEAIRRAYLAVSPDDAWLILREWLRVARPSQPWPSLGLTELGSGLAKQLDDDLRARALDSGTDFFGELVTWAPHLSVLRRAAELSADALIRDPTEITGLRVSRLERYLPYDKAEELRARLPVADPGLPDWRSASLADWFTTRYIPYVLQESHGGQSEPRVRWVRAHADQYAKGFLDYYVGLRDGADSERLAWVASNRLLSSSKESVTLLVVFDGLNYPDSQQLVSHLSRTCPRLNLDRSSVVLAPIPTVTDFSKLAIATGHSPAQAAEVPANALTTPDQVGNALRCARAGQVVVWTLNQPDHRYHYPEGRSARDRRRGVQSLLTELAQQVAEAVEEVDDVLPFRMVLTTDHGRLLGDAIRSRPIPAAMTAHGRAAWGDSDVRIGEEGFTLQDGLAFLHPSRFSLPSGRTYCAITSDETFRTTDDRGGMEPCPHGGLLPEEVLIPWVEFTRDRQPPVLRATISGDSEVGTAGVASLTVTNIGQVSVYVHLVTILRSSGTVTQGEAGLDVPPVSKRSTAVRIPSWPDLSSCEDTRAELLCRMPDGTLFSADCQCDLRSTSLYRQSDILGNLGEL